MASFDSHRFFPDNLPTILPAAAAALFALLWLYWFPAPRVKGMKPLPERKEARQVLSRLSAREQAYFRAHGEFAVSFEDLEFTYRKGLRLYTVYLDDSVLGRAHRRQALPPDQESYAEPHRFRAVAVANLDDDPALDVWEVTGDDPIPRLVVDDTVKR